MAIGTTNITTTLVRSTLQEDNNSVVGLANSEKINKWSKKKPVRGTWPLSVNNNYGIDFQGLWAYQRPRGKDYSEYFRLGDFRGYEHDQTKTLPPAYVRFDQTTFVGRSAYSPTGYYTISGTLKINTGQESEITLADLGLSNYYFGMYVNRPDHSEWYYKTLGAVVADNQYISASIKLSSPYTTYDDFPFLFQDNLPINVQFILSPVSATSWTEGNVGFRLPQEVVAGIDMRSSFNMTIAHWIIPDPSDVTFPYSGYSTGAFVIHSDINEYTLLAGFKLISKPSWLDCDVYDNINNRVATGAYYNGMSVRATPNSINNSFDRYDDIVLGDSSTHQLASISVMQQGKPATAYCTMDGFTSSPAASCSINSGGGSILVKFTPVGLSATAVGVGVTILRDGTTRVGFNNTHTARNGVLSSFSVDISPAAQRGHQYQVIISDSTAPTFTE